jgi:hypothetical protein
MTQEKIGVSISVFRLNAPKSQRDQAVASQSFKKICAKAVPFGLDLATSAWRRTRHFAKQLLSMRNPHWASTSFNGPPWICPLQIRNIMLYNDWLKNGSYENRPWSHCDWRDGKGGSSNCTPSAAAVKRTTLKGFCRHGDCEQYSRAFSPQNMRNPENVLLRQRIHDLSA